MRSLDHLPCLPKASPRLVNSCSHFSWMPVSQVRPRLVQLEHRGFVSSHLTLRVLHVKQPVRARFWTGALWSTDFLRGMVVRCGCSCGLPTLDGSSEGRAACEISGRQTEEEMCRCFAGLSDNERAKIKARRIHTIHTHFLRTNLIRHEPTI